MVDIAKTEYEFNNEIRVEVSGLEQTDGACEIDLSGYSFIKPLRHIQVDVEPSGTVTAGTLQPAVKSPGGSNFVDTVDDIDMVNGPLQVTFTARAQALQFTPSSFDGDSYKLIINVSA